MPDENLGDVLRNLENVKESTVISLKNDGNTYYKQGFFEEALDCYNQALLVDPDNQDVLNNKGLALVKLGRIDDAKKCQERIAEVKIKGPPRSEDDGASTITTTTPQKSSAEGRKNPVITIPQEITGMLTKPAETFRKLKERPGVRPLQYFAVLVGINLVLLVILAIFTNEYRKISYPFGYQPPLAILITGTILGPLLLAVIGAFVVILLLHAGAYIFGGRKGIQATATVFMLGITPLLLIAWILPSAGGLAGPVAIIAILWSGVLFVIGIRELHAITSKRSIGAVVVPTFLITLFILTIFIISYSAYDPMAREVHITANQRGDDILITNNGGRDIASLNSLTVLVAGMKDQSLGTAVGSTVLVKNPPCAEGRPHVVVTGLLTDGAQQVFYDSYFACGKNPSTPVTTSTFVPITTSRQITTTRTASAAIPGGLLVRYDFEENVTTNGKVTDVSGNGNDGTKKGTMGSTSGIVGRHAILFNGNGYILAPKNPVAGRTNVTVSFWFKTDNPDNNYKMASAASWNGGPGSGWTMATHIPEFWAEDTKGVLIPAQPNNPNNFIPGEWNFEVVTYDGKYIREYTNGNLINTWESRGVPLGEGVPMAVGGWPQFSGYNLVGALDDFRIYDYPFDAREISDLYNLRNF